MATYPDIANPVFTSGGIPFEYLYEDYTEQNIDKASNYTIKARVAWEDAADFLTDVLGYTDNSNAAVGATFFRRVPPLVFPASSTLYCDEATLVSYPSSNAAGVNVPDPYFEGLFQSDWAIYKLIFTRKPYRIDTDDNVEGLNTPELARYTMRSMRPSIRERTINTPGGLEVVATGQKIPTTAFVIDAEEKYIYTLCQVPVDLIPWDAISSCYGRINSSTLTDNTYSDLFVNGFTFAVHSLRLDGIASELMPYQGPNGVWYVDIPYMFSFRSAGTWRKLPDPGNAGANVEVKFSGITPTKYLYDEANFRLLFMPRAT